MEYEFKKNTLDGSYNASFSMGHEVVGRWLLEEFGVQRAAIESLIEDCLEKGISQKEWRHLGKHYSLLLQNGEVTIVANSLLQEDAPLDESHQQQDLDYYDDEMTASCGLEDLLMMLRDWIVFFDPR
ncbi:YacL family protein [Thaumasiovibrio sp. DFM-14]|uniref:YacL family protein n=1 Tax=Thaumasiovibrio sp. DFM-14 TaxID=3384792 RepID=UPI0039A17208